MTNPISTFIDGQTAEDLSRLFDPHEAVVLKQILESLWEGGWSGKSLEGILPILKNLNHEENRTNASFLTGHLKRLEANLNCQIRFMVNNLKVLFDKAFNEGLEKLFGDNQSRHVTALRRKFYLRVALVAMVLTWRGTPNVVHDGKLSSGRSRPTSFSSFAI